MNQRADSCRLSSLRTDSLSPHYHVENLLSCDKLLSCGCRCGWSCLQLTVLSQGRALQKSFPYKGWVGQTSACPLAVPEVWLLSRNTNIGIPSSFPCCLAGSTVKKQRILSVVRVKPCWQRLWTSLSAPLHPSCPTWQRRFFSTSLTRKVKHTPTAKQFLQCTV